MPAVKSWDRDARDFCTAEAWKSSSPKPGTFILPFPEYAKIPAVFRVKKEIPVQSR